jgi:hypothetical protein
MLKRNDIFGYAKKKVQYNWSKAWTPFTRLNTGVVGLNPNPSMHVCVCFPIFVLFCV